MKKARILMRPLERRESFYGRFDHSTNHGGPDLLLFMFDARLGATFDLAETIKRQRKMEKSRWNDLLASQEFQQR